LGERKFMIGCQPRYYARVLVYTLGVEGPRHRVVFAGGAELSSRLVADELDVALIPSIDYFRRPGLMLIPDMSVTAKGAAGCGLLAARTGLGNLTRVGVDPQEPALAALAAIFLKENFGVDPEWVACSPEEAAADASIDAWVMAAELGVPEPRGAVQVFDLGELWWRLARLPFVYGVWACRAGVDLQGLDKDLVIAKRDGLRRAIEVADFESARLGVDTEICMASIMRSFQYDLSRVELGGLQTFYRYAVRAGLVVDGVSLTTYRG
jgi:chorismate dehydratase